MNVVKIADRMVGLNYPPLVIAEIGINHEGSIEKAFQMIEDAYTVGCECIKFQAHVIDDEMIPNDVIPSNASESIWKIMERCALTEKEDRQLKKFTEEKGMIYLSTPFSRAAAERLERMNVPAYKIGSGECNNYPLVEHIASYGKPVILSTGMNSMESIARSVEILRQKGVPYVLMHCTSIYPTPYDKVRLAALPQLQSVFHDAVVGLSDHSLSNYPCLGAVALGASVLERHFTSDKNWPGPDINISMNPQELRELIIGSRAIFEARNGYKGILAEEKPTIDFAYACVVAIKNIVAGEALTLDNIWVKRPGTGEIKAAHFSELLGKKAKMNLYINEQLTWEKVFDA